MACVVFNPGIDHTIRSDWVGVLHCKNEKEKLIVYPVVCANKGNPVDPGALLLSSR